MFSFFGVISHKCRTDFEEPININIPDPNEIKLPPAPTGILNGQNTYTPVTTQIINILKY